ncbi:hypothetical protein U1Q18_024642 [Sarracenia purpurea var. burkii]
MPLPLYSIQGGTCNKCEQWKQWCLDWVLVLALVGIVLGFIMVGGGFGEVWAWLLLLIIPMGASLGIGMHQLWSCALVLEVQGVGLFVAESFLARGEPHGFKVLVQFRWLGSLASAVFLP